MASMARSVIKTGCEGFQTFNLNTMRWGEAYVSTNVSQLATDAACCGINGEARIERCPHRQPSMNDLEPIIRNRQRLNKTLEALEPTPVATHFSGNCGFLRLP
jgi:hypothetical protein